jgi:hypothetical protein
MYKECILGGLLALLGTSVSAAPATGLQTEEVTLGNGTRLVVIMQDDQILGIYSGDTLFASEEQLAAGQIHKPFTLTTRKGHYPDRLEKAPPLPDQVPEEVRQQLSSWRILDNQGEVMDTIFCTEQGCSLGGYSSRQVKR